VWKFPKERLYATVYKPGAGEPSELDQEAYDFWAAKFKTAGLDPKVHIVYGNKKDNFWMMGETGPCGPCSEIHVDLTPAGDTKGSLVNKGDARCIEIWNLVFIQFNANPDGTFSPLPSKHVDTGMGFERATSIIQGTKGFKDFANAKISNYETDIFRPIFDAIEKLSGKKYQSTLPTGKRVIKDGAEEKEVPTANNETEAIDVAFRVIADHIRTLSFAIADGIQPGIKGRNGVLRSIHKRMLRYASQIEIQGMLLLKTQDALVDTLAFTMGDVFSEIRREKEHIKAVLRQEADVFNQTLEKGLERFASLLAESVRWHISTSNPRASVELRGVGLNASINTGKSGTAIKIDVEKGFAKELVELGVPAFTVVPGAAAFELYDTYGFPLDLTELMARERGLTVDVAGFKGLMEEQKKRSQAAQKKEVVELSQIETKTPTKFVGFDNQSAEATILEIVSIKDKEAVILDVTPFYAEMGGQVGDTGVLMPTEGTIGETVFNTTKSGQTWLHWVPDSEIFEVGMKVVAMLDWTRRPAIQRHHTVTHLLHWALHEVVSKEASQKGSFVGPEKLTFDFNSPALTPQQVVDVEKLVNERIVENAGVSWKEFPYAEVKNRKDVMQFFGDKYGDSVRIVQVGGTPGALDGYSMELCGGTHTRATGEIGLFRIVGENAIAAGVRRIEAVAGLTAYDAVKADRELIKSVAGKVNSPVHELEKKIESLLAHQKELERQVKIAMERNASNAASELLERIQTVNGIPLITHNLGDADGDFLQAIADSLKGRFKGIVVLGGASNGAVALVVSVSPDFTSKAQAGKIIQAIAPVVGGKGGGKPDNARGGGKDATKLEEALAKVKTLI
jgi:alanyl-tRNA synthetase